MIIDRLIQQANDHSSRFAIMDAAQTLTYRELMRRVFERSDLLRYLRVRSVGISMDNCYEWIVTDLAAMHAGIPCIPLPGFFSGQQLLHTIRQSGISMILCSEAERFSTLGLKFESCRRLPGLTALFPQLEMKDSYVSGSSIAKITYTSGTTGQPRGVCLSQAVLDRITLALTERLGNLDIRSHLCVLPLSTLLENIAGVYVPLVLGRTIQVRPLSQLGFTGSSRLDPALFIQTLRHACADSFLLVPQLLTVLNQAAVAGLLTGYTPRFIAVGGGKTSSTLIHRARELGLPVYEGYGLSECASVVSLNSPGQDRPGSVGRPLSHVQVRITEGEIQVCGNTFNGYLGAHAQDTDWYATGDRGHIDEDGFLYVDGRSRDVLISSYGRNISPEWVESELLSSPLIAQCLVFGEARPACGAVIVPAAAEVTDSVLQAEIDRINLQLPDYARVRTWLRAAVPFTPANGLLTGNGKLNRARVLEHYQDQIETLYQTQEEVV